VLGNWKPGKLGQLLAVAIKKTSSNQARNLLDSGTGGC
jgi:hypothetical protein